MKIIDSPGAASRVPDLVTDSGPDAELCRESFCFTTCWQWPEFIAIAMSEKHRTFLMGKKTRPGKSWVQKIELGLPAAKPRKIFQS